MWLTCSYIMKMHRTCSLRSSEINIMRGKTKNFSYQSHFSSLKKTSLPITFREWNRNSPKTSHFSHHVSSPFKLFNFHVQVKSQVIYCPSSEATSHQTVRWINQSKATMADCSTALPSTHDLRSCHQCDIQMVYFAGLVLHCFNRGLPTQTLLYKSVVARE